MGALSQRAQWGTVREDYSANGDAWNYFPTTCPQPSLSLGRGRHGRHLRRPAAPLPVPWPCGTARDPILKERLFGLTNSEGNHGEDVKELYYYLDATPTHSYLKMLYKYPQARISLRSAGRGETPRGKLEPEFELIDTGIFDDDRYFDVFVEYAKAEPDDILMRMTVHQPRPEPPRCICCRRSGFATPGPGRQAAPRHAADARPERCDRRASIQSWATYSLLRRRRAASCCSATTKPTSAALVRRRRRRRLLQGRLSRYVDHGERAAVNPEHTGTKAAAALRLEVARRRQRQRAAAAEQRRCGPSRLRDFDAMLADSGSEADEFYAELQDDIADADARTVQRQALAGMIWSKQFYRYDVREWLEGDPAQPPPAAERRTAATATGRTSTTPTSSRCPTSGSTPGTPPGTWRFHCVPLALIDPEFAKDQLVLLTREWYMHPNGQMPAYEWTFSDVNPPVHAWAAWRVFQIDRKQQRHAATWRSWSGVFHKLLLNFTWWVNRKDAHGRKCSRAAFWGWTTSASSTAAAAARPAAIIDQADGTSWMAMYCLNLMRIALELAPHNHVYEDIATKFFEHFLHIAEAMTNIGGDGHRACGTRRMSSTTTC